jgi:hypothetical protein
LTAAAFAARLAKQAEQFLCRAAAWVSKLEVSAAGVPTKALSRDDLEQLIDDGKLAIKKRGI